MRSLLSLSFAGGFALGLVHSSAQPAAAFPEHDWGYPFCGEQPVVTSAFDHEYPTYTCPPNGRTGCGGGNGVLRLYNNTLASGIGYDGHNGWDFRTRDADGTNVKRRVYAVDDGVVSYAGWYVAGDPALSDCYDQVDEHERGYGLMVSIDHGGRESLYGHLSSIHVSAGERVSRDQIIGATGNTGNSTGPHLHYGVFDPSGPSYTRSTDPYGWNEDWRGIRHRPLPRDLDPWYRHSGIESERLMLPGAPDNRNCPTVCGPAVVVDDRDPGFELGCRAGSPCRYWFQAAQGYNGHLWWTYPNGSTVDYWARWTAPLPAGRYEVEVYLPMSARYATARAARYRVAGREVVVDQHEEGNVWVKLGIYEFRAYPAVELVDAVHIPGNYTYIGTCRNVAADAVRFTPVCGGKGSGGVTDPGGES